MGKFNQIFHQPVSNLIENSIDVLLYKIENFQCLNHDDAILKYIDIYYETRAYIENIFSDEFLNIIKKKIIDLWDLNKEDFEVKESTEKKILDYLLDVFLEHYSNSKFKGIEIED